MSQASSGDTVKVHYTGRLSDGTVFDSSEGREPLEFKIGEGQVIQGFDEGVVGMTVGDSKSVTIPTEMAYGERKQELMMEVGKDQLPQNLEPEVGQRLQASQNDGGHIVVSIAEVKDSTVVLDANHPLAGKELDFDISLVEIC